MPPRRTTRRSDPGSREELAADIADPKLRKELDSTFNDRYYDRTRGLSKDEPWVEQTEKAPAGQKRVKGKRIERAFIIGSEAWPLDATNRPPGIPSDHTTGWRVYVKSVENGPDISTWLSKVQFKIFNTYANPHRTVDAPPFEVRETGWGGFMVDIRLFFQSIAHEKAQYRQHFLQLEPYGSEEDRAKQKEQKLIRSETCEYIEFNEPTEQLFDALTSENQWDYLNKEKGKGKKGAGNFGHNRSVELAEQSTETNPYTKESERSQIVQLQQVIQRAEKLLAGEQAKRDDISKRLVAKREEEKQVNQA